MATKMNKIAVDESAKKYWELLWGEYGKALVRDIPRRIKAALVESKKTATVNENALLLPVAHAKDGDNLVIEGIFKDGPTKLMFCASIDKDGNVSNLKSFNLR